MKKGFVPSVCVVLLNAAYLYSFDSPSVFYVLNVLLHAGGGLLLTLALARVIRDRFRHWQTETRLAAVAGLLAGVSGAVLIYSGTSRPYLSLLRQKLYLHYKADESSQAITGAYRRSNPEDNNERQAIHEHESFPLSQIAAGRQSDSE